MGMFLVPLHLMSTTEWCFCGSKYKTIKSFQNAVKKRNASWKPRQLILPCIDTVGIQCGDTSVVLKTNNPDGFTSVSLLYKFHNAVCQRLDQHVELLYLVRISPADPSHGMVKFRAMLKVGKDDENDNDNDEDDYDDSDDENSYC